MVLTNTTFLGCGFKSLGFRVLSVIGAAWTEQMSVGLQRSELELCRVIYIYSIVCLHSKNQTSLS